MIRGTDAVPPKDPTRVGYDFIGWDNAYTNVTKDIICKAQYKENTIDVTYWDNIPNVAIYYDNYKGDSYRKDFYSDIGCIVQPCEFTRPDAIF